jgi:hypothetical protein
MNLKTISVLSNCAVEAVDNMQWDLINLAYRWPEIMNFK